MDYEDSVRIGLDAEELLELDDTDLLSSLLEELDQLRWEDLGSEQRSLRAY